MSNKPTYEELEKRIKTLEKSESERKQAEEEIKILSKMPSENSPPVLRVKQDGTIVYANKASNVLLQTWKSSIGENLPTFLCDLVYDIYKDTKIKEIEFTAGDQIFSLVIVPTTGAGLLNIYGRDITESKQALNEKEKRAAELVVANKELHFQNDEKEKHAAELIIANKELTIQNELKEKRAAELVVANKDKAKRADELVIAKADKADREAELIIANKELTIQSKLKEKRAAELIVANKELHFQNKEKEKRAAELEAKVQELSRMATVVMDSNDAIILQDLEGKILAWNRGAQDIYGYTEAEALEMNTNNLVAESDREASITLIERINQGEIVKSFELKRTTKDGRILDIWLTITSLKDERGKPISIATTERDTTKQRKAEEKLRISEGRYKSLVHNSPVSLWEEDWTDVIEMVEKIKDEGITDFENFFNSNPNFVNEALAKVKILDVNTETLNMFNAKHKTELLKSLSLVFATDDTLPGFIGELIAIAKGESLYEAEMKLCTVQGNVINTFVRIVFSNKDENSGRVLVSKMNITEIKKVQQEIKQLNKNLELRIKERTAELVYANKELEAFSYTVSHDLRAPLRHISGYIDLLTKRFPDSLPEKGVHYLNSIDDSANQMGMLIDDLLQFSRTGRKEMKKSKIDMNKLFQEVLETIKEEAVNRKIEWTISSFPNVFGDYSLLRLVWYNLLSNAVKFTQKKKIARIEIGFEEKSDEFVFMVRDNGAGFDMQYASKLFGVFQRLHSTEEYEGTGIGLANVQRIIRRHGGRTWAEAALDKGATFYFTLNNKVL